jgi:hypothetical protein
MLVAFLVVVVGDSSCGLPQIHKTTDAVTPSYAGGRRKRPANSLPIRLNSCQDGACLEMPLCQTASGFADLARQGGGAFVALVGIVITVAGLIGLKLYGNTGSLKQCTKGWKWTSSLTAWCVGQLLQLCAVELASEPVITAVSTLAVPANALLAWKILGEPVTRMERLAIAAMTVGAGMVVVSSPQQARPAMTVREEAALLTASVAPAIGLLVTLLVTQAG